MKAPVGVTQIQTPETYAKRTARTKSKLQKSSRRLVRAIDRSLPAKTKKGNKFGRGASNLALNFATPRIADMVATARFKSGERKPYKSVIKDMAKMRKNFNMKSSLREKNRDLRKSLKAGN